MHARGRLCISLTWWCCHAAHPRARRHGKENAPSTGQWPANRYAAGTEAACPPSCPTRDLRDARPAARGALTADQHYAFHERGFLVLPGLFSAAEVDALKQQVADLQARALFAENAAAGLQERNADMQQKFKAMAPKIDAQSRTIRQLESQIRKLERDARGEPEPLL